MEAKAPSRRAAAAKSFPRIKRVSARRAVNHSLGGNIATLAVLLLLALAALGGGWYLTGGDLAALPQKLQSLGAESLPHAGARLI